MRNVRHMYCTELSTFTGEVWTESLLSYVFLPRVAADVGLRITADTFNPDSGFFSVTANDSSCRSCVGFASRLRNCSSEYSRNRRWFALNSAACNFDTPLPAFLRAALVLGSCFQPRITQRIFTRFFSSLSKALANSSHKGKSLLSASIQNVFAYFPHQDNGRRRPSRFRRLYGSRRLSDRHLQRGNQEATAAQCYRRRSSKGPVRIVSDAVPSLASEPASRLDRGVVRRFRPGWVPRRG
jgi:hypothetical protein